MLSNKLTKGGGLVLQVEDELELLLGEWVDRQPGSGEQREAGQRTADLLVLQMQRLHLGQGDETFQFPIKKLRNAEPCLGWSHEKSPKTCYLKVAQAMGETWDFLFSLSVAVP